MSLTSLRTRLPAPAIAAARLARSLAYRAASPWEALLGSAVRRGLPPLWLRRHAGPVRHFESSAREMREALRGAGLWPVGGLLLDLGCGPGAMALAAREERGGASYLGLDVHAPSIRWCRAAFSSDPRFRFELLSARTPYSPAARGQAREARLPVPDGAARLVLAKSLFTHLLPEEAARYLAEIARAIGPEGRAAVTAFLFAPESKTPAFPYAGAQGRVRWRVRARPHAAVAYARAYFAALAAAAGLCEESFVPGFFPGDAPEIVGQDLLILRRAPC